MLLELVTNEKELLLLLLLLLTAIALSHVGSSFYSNTDKNNNKHI